jgi:hypothetical protein
MGSRLSQRYWNKSLWQAQNSLFLGYIVDTTLTVTEMISGLIELNTILEPTAQDENTTVSAYGTGTGGVGDYTISYSQTVGTAENPVIFTGYTANSAFNNIIIPAANLGNGATFAYIVRQLSSNSFLLQDYYDNSIQLSCTLQDNYTTPNVGDMYLGMMWYNADGGEGYYQAVAELNNNTVISFNSGYLGGGGDGGEGLAYQQSDGTWDVNMPWLLGSIYDTNLAQGWASIWTNTYYWDL